MPLPDQDPGLADHIRRYEETISRLERELADLEREWSEIPRLLWALVLVVPAWIIWSAAIGALVAVLVFVMTGVAYYLVGVRRSEWRNKIEVHKVEVAKLHGQANGARSFDRGPSHS